MKVFSGGHFMHEETFQVVVETCAMAQLCGQSPEWALAELKHELPGARGCTDRGH